MKILRAKGWPAALAVLIVLGALAVTTVAFARQGNPATRGSRGEPPATHTSPAATPPSISACSGTGMKISVEGTEGAAGTIRTLWRAQNVSGRPCRSSGYPAMDVHGSDGWLGVEVQHGGYADISETPRRVVVAPGHSLFFVSYWSDVTTDSGSCTEFDQARVILPGDSRPIVIASTGCLTPESVRVGPVTAKVA
jgi:Protein of unknown function (DUF4232)